MTKEQWKTVLETVTELDETARYNVPDEETDFWKIAEELDEKIDDVYSAIENLQSAIEDHKKKTT